MSASADPGGDVGGAGPGGDVRAAGERTGVPEAARREGGVGEGPPRVSPVALYSYLVTRHTGRAVRLGIQERLAECDRQILAVVDFREVQLIDFSCADEVVAKLVLGSLAEEARPRTFFLFRGIRRHHLDPVESALRRQGLAVAAESADGRPLLLGSVAPPAARAWHQVCRLGRAAAALVAARLGSTEEVACALLDGLHARRLLLRDRSDYVSFGRALVEADDFHRDPLGA